MKFTAVPLNYNNENMSHTMSSTMSSKKRKRQGEQGMGGHSAKRSSLIATNGNSDLTGSEAQESYSDSSVDYSSINANDPTDDISTTAAAALTAHLNGEDQGLSFGTAGSGHEDRPLEDSFGLDGSMQPNNHDSPYSLATYTTASHTLRDNATLQQKPAVGTEEWHKVRRDNHKEVERRRRETINEGINELAKIVPGSEKNKGSILQRAVSYINELKAKVSLLEEKKSMEKSVLETAVKELATQNATLKERNDELEVQASVKENIIAELRKRAGSSDGEDND